MTVTVSMPQLGESVTEGTVTRWLKKEGERVEADEPLLEVSTDKVDTEIPSPASGILRGITVAEDETVAVGAPLAIIDDGADGAGAAPADGQAEAAAAGPAPAPTQAPPAARPPPAPPRPARAARPAPPPAAVQAGPDVPVSTAEGPYITPLVRKLAAEHGVNLAAVAGTGVGGRIRKQDVLEAARVLREQQSAAATAPATAADGQQAPRAVAPAAPAASARSIHPSTLRRTTQRLSRASQPI